MATGNTFPNLLDEVTQIGRSILNVRYPKEFELYICALELVDQNGNTLKYFVFPVMPSSIEESQPQITNVKKTLGGIIVLSNPTFIPGDISLSGNFGRKFRVLLGKTYLDLTSSFKIDVGRVNNQDTNPVFSDYVKTGYGCCKILEEIVQDSKIIDSGGVRRLIFHNPSLGNSYLVKPMSFRFSMSQESNMIWNYSLGMKTIALLEDLQTSKDIIKQEAELVVGGYLQKKTGEILSELTSIFI